MKKTESVFQYITGKTLVPTDMAETNLLVADSWLVKQGRVRALKLHRKRFLSSCSQLAGFQEKEIAPFWEAVLERIPATGCWFPRIEMAGSLRQPAFQLRLRKAPLIHETIRLSDCKIADFRKTPRHKGPDLTKMLEIRKKIRETGADEGILTTPKGFLLEGLTTTLIWWEGKTLCTVSPSHRVLPGVTAQLIQSLAEKEHIRVACRLRKPQDLNGCEVWAVNALHGIRQAINWKHTPFKTSFHTDIGHWRKALDCFLEKI